MNKKNATLIIPIICLLGGITGCNGSNMPNNNLNNGEDKPALFAKISNNQEVVNAVNGLVYEEEDVLQYKIGTSVSGKAGTTDDGNATKLTVTTKVKKDAKSGTGEISTLNASDVLYPGALLIADDKLVSGTPTVCPLNRGTAKFSVNLPDFTDREFECQVNQTNVQNKINEKLDAWAAQTDASRTASTSMSITQAYSKDQIDASLGFGMGEKLGISAEVTTTNEKRTFIVSVEDVYFTANVLMDNNSNTIFGAGVTAKDINDWSHDKNGNVTPPLIINTCEYGKMIYFKIETDLQEDELKLAFSYAGSIDADAQAEFNNMTKNSTMSCIIYGGKAPTTSLTSISKSNPAKDVLKIYNTDASVSGDDIKNYKLLSYNCNFIDHQQRSAGIVSTSEYIETTYKTINQQDMYIECNAGYEIWRCWIFGQKIDSWTDDGKPVFSNNITTLYEGSHLAYKQHITFLAPANYGRIKFKYSITLGCDPAYDARVYSEDFFEDCDIYTEGTSLMPKTHFIVDGHDQYL